MSAPPSILYLTFTLKMKKTWPEESRRKIGFETVRIGTWHEKHLEQNLLSTM